MEQLFFARHGDAHQSGNIIAPATITEQGCVCARMTCRVIAWEPVPLFRDFFRFGIAVNGFEQLITVRSAIL
jgi:hypothetical protein